MRERYSRWCKSPLKFKRRERPTSVGDGAISLIGRAGLNTRGHECTYILFYFLFTKFTWSIMRKLKKKFIGGFIYEKKQSGLCMGT